MEMGTKSRFHYLCLKVGNFKRAKVPTYPKGKTRTCSKQKTHPLIGGTLLLLFFLLVEVVIEKDSLNVIY